MLEIYQGDCFDIMQIIDDKSVDCILTSPPYNTSKPGKIKRDKCDGNFINVRYLDFNDNRPPEEYIAWTVKLFNSFDRILKSNGVVLYNLSYGNNSSFKFIQSELMFLVIYAIISKTNFTIVDKIVWQKKRLSNPDNSSKNKLTRVYEDVFVFARRNEYKTFFMNKKVIGYSKKGRVNYKPINNLIVADNNDEVCQINKATYSSELCMKLLKIYCKKGFMVYDPFIGTGTTAIACEKLGLDCIGSELSREQVKYSIKRIKINFPYLGEDDFYYLED